MKITRLIYVSKASSHISEDDIRELTEVSISRNAKLKLTGYLTYRDNQFLQYLEGSDEHIEEIWASIKKDPRHDISQFWKYESDGPRFFPNWHMRYLRADKADDRIYDILARTFEAMRPPISPDVSDLLDNLIGEIAEQTKT